jgi:spermidine synthase
VRRRLLLLNVFVVAFCALVYELVCGTVASYLLGGAVSQFALVLGTYLFAMGAGAWLSRRAEAHAANRFVQAELALALLGGLSAPLLMLAFGANVPLRPMLYALVFAIGALVGVELPLLIALLSPHPQPHPQRREEQAEPPAPAAPAVRTDAFSRALALDYAGALGASLLFPLVLVPRLGLVRTSVAFGLVNVAVAVGATALLRPTRKGAHYAAGVAVTAALLLAFARAETWVLGAVD